MVQFDTNSDREQRGGCGRQAHALLIVFSFGTPLKQTKAKDAKNQKIPHFNNSSNVCGHEKEKEKAYIKEREVQVKWLPVGTPYLP